MELVSYQSICYIARKGTMILNLEVRGMLNKLTACGPFGDFIYLLVVYFMMLFQQVRLHSTE
jgi:hypothetical protein